jgi:hypothetical protein
MADNSNQETSNFSFNDAMTSLLRDPAADNQAKEEAAPAEGLEPEAEASEDEAFEGYETDEDQDDADDADDDEEDAFDDDDRDDDDEPQTVTATIDGEEVEITIEEAVAGYQRQSAFTKRMQQLASDRKAFEAEAAQTKQMRDAYAQGLTELSEQLQSMQADEPDWDRAYDELDAKEYARLVQVYNQRKEHSALVEQERQRIAQEQNMEHQQLWQRHLKNEGERMIEVIPAWADNAVRDSERKKVIQYAQTLGYTAQEISQASDHRAVKALYDSWKLSQINQSAGVAKKKVRKAPKMAKAGTPRAKGESQTRRKKQLANRLDSERSVNAAVELLLG